MEPLFFVLFFMMMAGVSVLRYYGLIGYPSSYSLLPSKVESCSGEGGPFAKLALAATGSSLAPRRSFSWTSVPFR